MRQISLVTIATVLALSLGGCFGQNDTTTTETSPETSAESPVAVSPATESSVGETDGTASTTAPDATPDATPPPLPQANVATLPRDLDLIPSTNPDQRVQSVQGERSDPFSVVPTTPSVQIEILDDGSNAQAGTTPGNGQAGGTANNRSAGSGAAGGRSASSGSGAAGGRSASSGGGLAPVPNLVPGRSTATPTVAPPRPPQPTLARAVEVLGVVQIGSVPYAIVSAPNEPTSRYVREGQRLSNGQIVVRRIEMNGPTPAVVFEQHGIEVITAVGEGGAPAATEVAPAAVLPPANERQLG